MPLHEQGSDITMVLSPQVRTCLIAKVAKSYRSDGKLFREEIISCTGLKYNNKTSIGI